jgi:hypothetical protein
MSAAEHQPLPRLSERDRRFALLVLMMSSTRGRWRRLRPARRENVMDPDEQPVVTSGNKERVRAGVTGHNVRYVLLASLALVVVLFVAVELVMR